VKPDHPSAQVYSAQTAIYPAMTVVDLRSEAALVTEPYKNQMLFDINDGCMRLSGLRANTAGTAIRHPTSCFSSSAASSRSSSGTDARSA